MNAMLRSLQFHEYEMIIAIVFLHYPDLQNRQLPPGMWFLHFGHDMAQGNQERGLPASPTGRRVRLALGRAERKGEKCHQFPLSSGGSSLEEVPEAQAECGVMHTPGLQKPPDAGIPPPCSHLAGLRSKHL